MRSGFERLEVTGRLLRSNLRAIAIGMAVVYALAGLFSVSAASAVHRSGGWHQRDRAVYVVSTLNAPICPSGQELSRVLIHHFKAKLFVVLRSKTSQNLYYVQVKDASKSTLGVYAYRFGWKQPRGVQHGHCVGGTANPGIVRTYASGSWVMVAKFHNTVPQG